MKQLHCLILLIPILLPSLWSNGQLPIPTNRLSNLRQKRIVISDTIRLDSLSIVPNSLTIAGESNTEYKLDFVNAIVTWNHKPAMDSVLVSYRVFPNKLNAVTQHYNYDSISKIPYLIPFTFNAGQQNSAGNMFQFGNVKTQGSFGRQMSFGNSQDAVLNSNLNLQMEGMLGDSIEIHAAITDNNLPIQPEGNTQQLNEFDRVFLQFKKPRWQLDLGDIDIRQGQSYFLNFYKRLRGISFATTNPISSSVNSNTLISGSVAKGKFWRNILEAREGNQGPYRLSGANNELFFILLANTERVFIDGELMQRGEDQDYVINYNTAEITFTPKRMITKDTRIQVDFEYADRNYLNANLYLSQEFEISKKLKLRLGAFNNNDAKNSPVDQSLDDTQKKFLADIGDSIQNAIFPNAQIDTLAPGKILYEKIYSGTDSFYQYSTNPNAVLYSLSFVFLGAGKGNYIVDPNGVNGKVYKYVAPSGNTKLGSYEPGALLAAPKKQQLFNFGINYALDKNTSVMTEVAMSNYDINTFSSKNDNDNIGYAAKLHLNNVKNLGGKNLQLTTGVDYEYTQNKFKPLERIRRVEFSRDWGLPLILNDATENIVNASAQLRNRDKFSLSYQIANYHRSDNYNGIQHSILQYSNLNGWQFNNQFVITNYKTDLTSGSFLRPIVDLSKELKVLSGIIIGGRWALEDNDAKYKSNDSLLPASFSFNTYSLYMQSGAKSKDRYGITFFSRTDKYPVGKDFVNGNRSYNINLKTELISNPHHQFILNSTFRTLKVLDASVSPQKNDNTILGRAEYLNNLWKGLLTGNVLYEIGAGQEPKRDFAYLEVPAGTGQYTWIDYNNNGIQELNEFEIAAFPDQAKFIRIFTPTNEFIKANYNTLNYSFALNPRSVINMSTAKAFARLLSKTTWQSSMQISKKSVAKGDFDFNPFQYDLNDTALLNLSTSLVNSFSYNRFRTGWGFEISNLRNSGKALLTYGYESRRLDDWLLKMRWTLKRSLIFELNTKKELNTLSTPNPKFVNRNYNIEDWSIEPRLNFTNVPKSNFRLITGFVFENKKNDTAFNGGQKAASKALNVESTYNIVGSAAITAKFTYNQINYSTPHLQSDANSTVGYILLNGLMPGKNYLWSLSFTKKLIHNLELRFDYEGRKPGESRTVHRGTASVNALF